MNNLKTDELFPKNGPKSPPASDLQGNFEPEPRNLEHPREGQGIRSALLNTKNSLLIGIGNNSRADDGLGWAFLDAVEQWTGFEGDIEYRYQLQVEDAALIANYSSVILIDAYQGALPMGFRWEECRPAPRFEFSTHALAPGSVLFLCQDLYQASPTAFTLAIAGTEWGLKEGLSTPAQANLQAALHSFRDLAT